MNQQTFDQLQILQAETNDASEVYDLWQQIETWGERNIGRIWHPYEITKEVARAHIEKHELYILRSDETKKIVATITIQSSDPTSWPFVPIGTALYIQRVAVARGYAGQGIGRYLLEFVESVAAKEGCDFLRLDCDADRPKLCEFYESFGFEPIGSAKIAGFNATLYEKCLQSEKVDNKRIQNISRP